MVNDIFKIELEEGLHGMPHVLRLAMTARHIALAIPSDRDFFKSALGAELGEIYSKESVRLAIKSFVDMLERECFRAIDKAKIEYE